MAGKLELNNPSPEAIETTRQQCDATQGMAGPILWHEVRRKMEKLDPSFMN